MTQESSLLSIAKLEQSKDYEFVAVAGENVIFVDSTYFGLFGIRGNSIGVMRTDESAVAHVFCGHDGTISLKKVSR